MSEQKDKRIYYMCLHSCCEDDYDYQTHHLYLEGLEAYNLMLDFVNDICIEDEIEATHQIALDGTCTYDAMDLEAVKEDIKCQFEDECKQNQALSNKELTKKWQEYFLDKEDWEE